MASTSFQGLNKLKGNKKKRLLVLLTHPIIVKTTIRALSLALKLNCQPRASSYFLQYQESPALLFHYCEAEPLLQIQLFLKYFLQIPRNLLLFLSWHTTPYLPNLPTATFAAYNPKIIIQMTWKANSFLFFPVVSHSSFPSIWIRGMLYTSSPALYFR